VAIKRKIFLCCGNQANQKALAHKLYDEGLLDGLIIEDLSSTNKFFNLRIISRFLFFPLHHAWFKMLKSYDELYPSWPDISTFKTTNINEKFCVEYLQYHQPDLVLISGTRLIKGSFFQVQFSIGIINLHTGLSPYVRGGPNCTNWCIVNRTPHLIGNTIMWLSKGIDSGNIITSRKLKLTGKESFSEIHKIVMEDAHHLYIEASKIILSKPKNELNSVPQKQLPEGILYLSKMWNTKQRIRLLFILLFKFYKRDIKSENYLKLFDKTLAIPL
jgi:folate-dependent phosphoribosylglycinamide formyltransferase PurN